MHQYVDAPTEVHFLSYPHRHMLHITVQIEVFDDDRELEFIMVKRELDDFLKSLRLNAVSNRSCEMIAHLILTFVKAEYCEIGRDIKITVSEDGENGSVLEYTN